MMDLEPIAVVYAGCVGVGLVALDSLSHAVMPSRGALCAAFGAVVAFSGYGDEILAFTIAFAIARAIPQPAGGDNRAGAKLLAGLSVLFFALVGSGPFPWDDLRTWVWPIAALLVRAGLPSQHRGNDQASALQGDAPPSE